MSLMIAAAALSLFHPAATDGAVDVAYQELAADQNQAAITRIEANSAAAGQDPASQINLAVAYAREGRVDKARELLNSAAQIQTRYWLETANGDWVDSRQLAIRALAMIDNGQLSAPERMASR